jgi:uncharacterized protein DUF1475
MIWFLRGLFLLILAFMVGITTWASLQCPLFGVPHAVATHPWFLATLGDAYWGFVTFFVWVAYKQVAWPAKLIWLIAIILLGNIAMSAYCLRELFGVPARTPLADILTRRRPGFDWLGAGLAALGLAVTLAGIPLGKS